MMHAGASSLGRDDLHALFLSVPWPVVVFRGPDHVVELANDSFFRIAGDTRGVVIGRPFREVFPDLMAQGLSAVLDRALESGETFVRSGFRALVDRPDGPYEGYWDVTVQPIRGMDGQVAGLLASTIEVTERVRTVERVKVLADAGLLLDAELDLDRTLQNLADLLVPRLADYCIVDLVEGARLRRVLTAHANPARRELVERLRAFDPDLSDPIGVGLALARDTPLLAEAVHPEQLDAAARSPEHGAILRALGARSSILFPLRTHGPALGLLTVAFAESGRRYAEADLQLVSDLARRAALAISTARSVRAERRAAERVTRLQAVTSALINAITVSAVAEIVLREGSRALGADACVVQLLDAGGAHLDLVGSHGIPPERASRWLRQPLTIETPTVTCVRTREPVFIESAAEWARRYPTAASSPLTGSGARAALPLLINGALIGAVGFGFIQDRSIGADDREFMEALAGECALALERARLFDAEAAARRAAEAAVDRVTRLQQLTSALSIAVTVEDVVRTTLAESFAALGATAGGVWLVGAEPGALELVHSVGFGDHAGAYQRLNLADPVPLTEAVRLGQAVFLATRDERARRYPQVGDGARAGFRAWVAVPLTVQAKIVGGFSLSFPEEQRFSEADRDFITAIATQAAQAVERARLYEAVVERERQARLAEQRKDEFLAMLGHELRNPLSPIQVGVEIIRRKAGQAVARECAILDRQLAHLTRLVDDLLDVARITRGKTELRRERQDLGPVVAHAVEIARPQIDARRHELCVAPVEAGLIVDIDAVRIAQVISNLLTNAARYTPPGGRIDVHAGREGGCAVVRVTDNGVGIPEHMLSAVFELFVQGERRLDRSEGGLGVGLTLARTVVEMHGGSIKASSEGAGRGSEFTVRLPLCD